MSASKALFVWLVVAIAVVLPLMAQPAAAAVHGESLGALCPETGSEATILRQDNLVLDGRTWQRLETRLNSFTSSRQDWPTIGMDGEGRFWTAWQSRRQEVVEGVYGRCLDSSGRFLSNEMHLNLHLPMSQGRPVAVPDTEGNGGWVAWESAGQDGHLGGLYARRFGPYLGRGGEEIRLNSITEGNQTELAACSHGRGGLAAAWTGPGESGETTLFLRFFDAAGRPTGDEQPMRTAAAPGARTPSICALSGGGVALAWTAFSAENRPDGIFLHRFDPDGKPLGDPSRVSRSTETWRDVEPAMAHLADGSLVVAWPSVGADGDDYGILARIIDPSGMARGPVFTVNDLTAGLQNGPAIAADPQGGFVILWNHFDSLAREAHVRGRFFHESGVASDSGFRLTSSATGNQRLQVAAGRPQALFHADGSLAVCWSGNGGLGDEKGAHLTLLVPEASASRSGSPEWQQAFCRRVEENLSVGQSRDIRLRQSETVVSAIDVAKPHVPPVYDPRSISKDPYGGDRSPFPLADEGFIAITNTGWGPPDPHMAVGPNHVVAMVNGGIAFLDKTGNNLFQDEIEGGNGFWGSVGATSFVFDPEVIFDPHDQRFIAMACEDISGSSSYFLLAVSDDDDPMGTWYKYRIDSTEYAADFLDSGNLAVDADAVYLTGDVWTSVNYMIYILDKTPLLTGAPAVITNTLTITGTQSHGIPVMYGDAPAMYMIEHFESGTNTAVRLHAITDPLGSPTRVTHNVPVTAYGWPNNPPQMGTSTRPNLFDARFWHCVWRNGSLWAAHHVGNPVRARWYQIATNGWPASGTPELVQSGEIDPGPDIHTFFNSITVDALGNAATCFARSASDEYISMSRATRLAADPAGTMGAPVILKESNGAYTSGRWGDYSTVAVDPADGTTFWAHHEYTPGGNSWNTWAASFQADGGEPVPLIAAGPGPGPSNPPDVRLFSAASPGSPLFSFTAYGVDQFGVNVAVGDIDGDGVQEIVTGPGPGAVFGPHVRGWEYNGTAIPGVNFQAYGTLKFGVNVACGDIDGDGIDEIITGAGPGAVFGPHVRAWNYDGGTLESISGISFFAYGTLKYGVNVACGDLDNDGIDEIITGAGPGAVFGPHVRSWNYDGGTVAPMTGVSYLAYGTNQFGVNVACGDLDGDGDDEIITGPGPGVVFGTHVRGWDVTGGIASALNGVSFVAYPAHFIYGARVGTGDLDGDGMDEILTTLGPGTINEVWIRGWNVDGGTAEAIATIDFYAFGSQVLYGGNATVVDRP